MTKKEYKRAIHELFYQNEEIQKAILNDAENFTTNIPTPQEVISMSKNNIFKYFLITEALGETSSYIMMAFRFKYKNVAIESVDIRIRVYTHKDYQETGQGYERNDHISELLENLLDGNNDLGIGELTKISSIDIDPIGGKYIGEELMFTTHRFS